MYEASQRCVVNWIIGRCFSENSCMLFIFRLQLNRSFFRDVIMFQVIELKLALVLSKFLTIVCETNKFGKLSWWLKFFRLKYRQLFTLWLNFPV